MSFALAVLGAITIVGAAGAMCLRNLVHCVLALTVGLVGLAAIYLNLGAQFVGFTQILVYIGAVAILAVFAIMMTRAAESTARVSGSSSWLSGTLIAGLVFAVLAWAIYLGAPKMPGSPPQPDVSVDQIGTALMHRFVLPLEVIGVLLTGALIGAGVLAMHDKGEPR